MNRKLPPLNGLRAFEAAARLMSFSKAADELHVTPAAISQQIKSLEAFYGTALFHRSTRALSLSDAGAAALPLLSEGFDRLAEGTEILDSPLRSGLLTISVTPSFGSKWLLPRLDGFRELYPEYEVRIDASNDRADFTRDGVDIALRYGRGHYPGLVAEQLMPETAFPVCSPALLEGEHPLRQPEDLIHHVLLHVNWKTESAAAPSWRMWLAAAGIGELQAAGGLHFTMDEMAAQAAVNGMGVLLTGTSFIADDLKAGRLVQPFPKEIRLATEFRNYLVYPERSAQSPKVQAFRDWALSEAREQQDQVS